MGILRWIQSRSENLTKLLSSWMINAIQSNVTKDFFFHYYLNRITFILISVGSLFWIGYLKMRMCSAVVRMYRCRTRWRATAVLFQFFSYRHPFRLIRRLYLQWVRKAKYFVQCRLHVAHVPDNYYCRCAVAAAILVLLLILLQLHAQLLSVDGVSTTHINFTDVEILLNRNRFINDHESVFLTLIVYIFINCSLICDKNLDVLALCPFLGENRRVRSKAMVKQNNNKHNENILKQ